MLRYFLFFLLITGYVQAQSITGQVLIYGTEDPLPDASVYYDGSFKGGVSDENGNFCLDSTDGRNPIIISAVGYHSTSIADYKSSEFLKVYLEPKTYNLDAVVITYDGMSREEKEAIFKKEFIGVSVNSQQCEIVNLDDINLVYNRKRQTIEASANEPIILHNKALGFKVTYFLERFSLSPDKIFFSGNYFFESDSTLSARELLRVERRRRSAYLGSRMHFVRALYNNQLAQEGFELIHVGTKPGVNSQVVVESKFGKGLFIESRLGVIYRKNLRGISFLDKVKDFTFIDKNGFYDPAGLTWSGKMADQRMSDLLPFEYIDKRIEKD